jgi:hypothetical protein
MADKLNPRRIAIGLGSFVAVVHFLWAVVVAAGYGQAFVNWKLSLMFLSGAFTVNAFDPVNAALLIVLGFVGGAVFGWLFASVWNYSAKFK